MYDYLIVGAGLAGATCARALADAGKRVLIVERREVIGGNCHDEYQDGIRVSTYGGHIFHTNSRRVWEFVNRFTTIEPYEHRVKACYYGKVYSFPPNKLTLQQLEWAYGDSGPQTIREIFFDGYTAKQWGDTPPPHVAKRIPIRSSYDDRYYSDKYQGLPNCGYTQMIWGMLDDIPVELGEDYTTDREYWDGHAKQVIYTGSLDELYGFDLLHLPYRSLRFEHERLAGDYQGCATMNYTGLDVPYTRIMEWKHFGWKSHPETVITREYPLAHDGTNERYYPINTEENDALHRRYFRRAEQEGLIVCGRLGSYRYLNMDQTIAQAMLAVEQRK
jgi:UDP-galactopyranose mutase